MDERMTSGSDPVGWRRAGLGSRRAAGIAAAVVIATIAVVASPATQPTHGGQVATTPLLVGEHSALGPRQVEAINRAIASMQQLRGEHAGIAIAEYEAESASVRLHLRRAAAGPGDVAGDPSP